MASELQAYINHSLLIVTNDGRIITGTLKGFDQTTNIILTDTYERVFSPEEPVELVPLGLYIIRGDNISVLGELDVEKDEEIPWTQSIKAEPISPIKGLQFDL